MGELPGRERESNFRRKTIGMGKPRLQHDSLFSHGSMLYMNDKRTLQQSQTKNRRVPKAPQQFENTCFGYLLSRDTLS